MSAKDSNLSESGYGYDLVSAITQKALNANLKQFWDILGQRTPPVTEYYKFADAYHESTVKMTDEEVQEMTGGVDIFDIPDGTRNDSEEYGALGDKMASMDFAYAFQAGMGRPPGIDPGSMPDIISLAYDPGRSSGDSYQQTVQYSLYFGSLTFVEILYGNGVWTIRNVSQPDDDPWIWQWQVDLNLQITSGEPFSSLDENTQKNIKAVYNCNSETMFSLQQLLLDMNTFSLISGLDSALINSTPDDTIYTGLNAFVSEYWLSLVSEIESIPLNSSVSPEGQDYPPSSIVPTDLNFVVSPYSNSADIELYTLNYLVMSDQHKMPDTIVPFNWNWVDDESIQGIMSVRREVFLGFLNQALAPCLTDLCLTVDVQVDTEDGYFRQGDATIDLLPNDTPREYTYNSENPFLSFSYQSRVEDTDLQAGLYLIPKGMKLIADLKVDSNITLSENTIVCETIVSMYFEYDIDGILSKTKGYPLAQKNVTTFYLDAVGTGNTPENSTAGLLLISSDTKVDELAQDDDKDGPYYNGDYDPSFVAKLMSGGAVNSLKEDVEEIKTTLNTLMDGYTAQVSELVDGSLGFVFPGAQTYLFANPAFSGNCDLTVQVAFQSPS